MPAERTGQALPCAQAPGRRPAPVLERRANPGAAREPLERLWRWARRNPLVAALTVGIAFSLFAGTIVSWVFAVRAQFEANAFQAAGRAQS